MQGPSPLRTEWPVRGDQWCGRCRDGRSRLAPNVAEFGSREDVTGPSQLIWPLGFLRALGVRTRKPVTLTRANAPAAVLVQFDPVTGTFRLPEVH